ncbi:T9SS type A sorting domain-containing protein [Epilithonimonas xixisoli]|uniref:Putative secreted protein (Por secretion system target) n=1 Tax=Epilithonimonas xixisoli TaxID=1476462 RepID=A0A4R8I6Z6_9FLAO|nr:T9SS type A sorting domain-containing protein [Epilithonimonas xixisoli]TDX84757.1 putative secreted protein (Por secretion system target) [Epilithonimonas xixisoli]
MKKILFSCAAMFFATNAYSQFWTNQFTGFADDSRGILGIHAKDTNNVWAYAFDGVAGADIQEFTKTTDGGAQWTAGIIDLGDPSLNIQSIVGADANTAWVMASREADGTGGVFKTSDGGDFWDFQIGGTTPDESWNNWVHFYDTNNGVFMSDPVGGYFELYTTSDGGANWTRVPSANIPAPLNSEYGYTGGYTYVGDAVFFYTNRGRILKSTDKGLTWSVILPTGYVTDFGTTANSGLMSFSDANKGIVFRKSANSAGTPTALNVYRTTNGGSTWETVNVSGINVQSNITSISYVPGTNTIIAAAVTQAAPGSYISKDNGSTWTQLDAVQHTSIKCIGDVCYSGGYSDISTNSGMFKSTESLAVNDIADKNSVSVFPNPATDYFKINVKGYDDAKVKVSITDVSGKLVKSFSSQDSYNVSDLTKGVYIITVTDGTKSEAKKIIKK